MVIRSAHSCGRRDRIAGTNGNAGASSENVPRSTSLSTVVAVAILVIENHGMTMSVAIGVPETRSARPTADRARAPSRPTTTNATPGTLRPMAERTRSSRSSWLIIG